ncbi:MAG: hypothetical protein WB615_01565 [Candidatus Tumulicola sp.]
MNGSRNEGGDGVERSLRGHRHARYQDIRSDASGRVRPDLWVKGVQDTLRMRVAPPSARLAVGATWQQIGPAPLRIDAVQQYQGVSPVAGEVVGIVIDPSGSSDQTFYVATNDGGVWKSTDAGSTWVPKMDTQDSPSMGAIAFDSASSTLYVGTGNGFDGGHAFDDSTTFYKGVGVYSSTDGGDTWTLLGGSGSSSSSGASSANNPFVTAAIVGIIPMSSNVLLVGSSGGVYRSVDGGNTWGANAPSFNDGNPVFAGKIYELRVDTANASIVYAAVSAQGIFQSNDGGITFKDSDNLFKSPGAPATFAYVSFAQSTKPDNSIIYASVATDDSTYDGLYQWTSSSKSWKNLPDAKACYAEYAGHQLGYDLVIDVDPQDANRVYVGFQELYLSTQGGTTFGRPSASHAKTHWDQHAVAFSPPSHWGTGGAPTRMYLGSDGGIAVTGDGGVTWTPLNEGVATNLFYGIDIGRGSDANRAYTFGGCQDTGTVGHRPGDTGNDWHMATNGDGGPVAVDPNNPQRIFTSSTGAAQFSSDGGNSWSNASGITNPPWGATVHFAFDPHDSSIVYACSGKDLYVATGSTTAFAKIASFAQSITALVIDPSNSNRIWLGFTDGSIQLTDNAKASPPAFRAPAGSTGVTNRRVGAIAVDRKAAATSSSSSTDSSSSSDDSSSSSDDSSSSSDDSSSDSSTARSAGLPDDDSSSSDDSTSSNGDSSSSSGAGSSTSASSSSGSPAAVVVVYQGFSTATSPSAHVFISKDDGATWSDVSGSNSDPTQNVPDLPVHTVVLDETASPSTIVVGNDSAVLASTDGGATWSRLGTGLPNVECASLALDSGATPSLLRVGTYGRSAFELVGGSSDSSSSDSSSASDGSSSSSDSASSSSSDGDSSSSSDDSSSSSDDGSSSSDDGSSSSDDGSSSSDDGSSSSDDGSSSSDDGSSSSDDGSSSSDDGSSSSSNGDSSSSSDGSRRR